MLSQGSPNASACAHERFHVDEPLRVSPFADEIWFHSGDGFNELSWRSRSWAIGDSFGSRLNLTLLLRCHRDYPGRAAEQAAHSPDEIYIFPCSLRRWPYGRLAEAEATAGDNVEVCALKQSAWALSGV